MKDVLLPKSGCGKAGGRSMVEHILPNTSREASTEAQTSIYKASMGGPGLLIWTPCPSYQSSHTWAFNATEAESGTNAWIKSKWQVLFRSGRIPYVTTPHSWLNPDPPLYSCSPGRGSNSSILPCRISHTHDACPQHSCTACTCTHNPGNDSGYGDQASLTLHQPGQECGLTVLVTDFVCVESDGSDYYQGNLQSWKMGHC